MSATRPDVGSLVAKAVANHACGSCHAERGAPCRDERGPIFGVHGCRAAVASLMRDPPAPLRRLDG